MHRAAKSALLSAVANFAALIAIVALSSASAFAQNPPQIPPPYGSSQSNTYTLKKNVDMVRLPVTIVDKNGSFVPGLAEDNFRVLENNTPQKISAFTHADIPISVGLVIDNSGSMKSKRSRVNAAAMTFVQTSNPQDQMFVVNFNDEYYLDMDEDFTNDPKVLKAALERIDSRGGTALYDALLGSMSHLKKGAREKKVLLVVTDGVDHDSAPAHNLSYTVQKVQQANVVIYAVGLFTKNDDSREEIRQGKKALLALADASGGEAYFPKTVDEVDEICTRIAQDIRSQYMVGYYPSNEARDGAFRAVRVELTGVRGLGKLTIRTRPGYYAPTAGAQPVSGN
ncbi:MAG: VWA domain-containing protein [Candidatus Acidiferrales bacterium]